MGGWEQLPGLPLRVRQQRDEDDNLEAASAVAVGRALLHFSHFTSQNGIESFHIEKCYFRRAIQTTTDHSLGSRSCPSN